MTLFEEFEDRYGDERISAKEAIRLCKFHGTDIAEYHKYSGYTAKLSESYDWQAILIWLGY
jgi:hypothetical protein